jgi:hypothetical protein
MLHGSKTVLARPLVMTSRPARVLVGAASALLLAGVLAVPASADAPDRKSVV